MASRNNGKHRTRHHIQKKAPRTITLPPLPVAEEVITASKETATEIEQPIVEVAATE